jgi:NAD(P)-dependent dehydrogenase (short-subunit alcohol dehydrogenase family)
MTTVILITGCSTGIGKFTALEFASKSKFTVWATMRDTSKWDQPPRLELELGLELGLEL